jgi:putative ABC transport system permease protein
LPDEQKEVTAVLVKTIAITLPPIMIPEINDAPYAQAANPGAQISWLMRSVLGNIRTLMIIMTTLIILVSGVGIFVSIYNSMAGRRKEIAIMRSLGAGRSTVFSIVLSEAVLLCLAGGLCGMLLGHGLVFIAAPIVERQTGLLIDPLSFDKWELVLFPSLIALASLIGIIPGLTAYRTDVASNLN